MDSGFGRFVRFPLVRLVLILVAMGVLFVPIVVLLHRAGIKSGHLEENLMAAVLWGVLFLFVHFVERRPFLDSLFPLRAAPRGLGVGFLYGAGLISVVVAVLAALGFYRIDEIAASAVPSLLRATWFFFVVGVFEETLFRAVLFRLLEETFGTWPALATSSLLFGLAHLGQPHASIVAAIAIAVEAGMLLGALYLQERTMWLPIGVHWAWNLTEGPIFGTSVSGTSNDAPLLTSTTTGPAIVTGGEFGPEAGLVAIAICGAAGVFFCVRAVKRGHTMGPVWRRKRSQNTATP